MNRLCAAWYLVCYEVFVRKRRKKYNIDTLYFINVNGYVLCNIIYCVCVLNEDHIHLFVQHNTCMYVVLYTVLGHMRNNEYKLEQRNYPPTTIHHLFHIFVLIYYGLYDIEMLKIKLLKLIELNMLVFHWEITNQKSV